MKTKYVLLCLLTFFNNYQTSFAMSEYSSDSQSEHLSALSPREASPCKATLGELILVKLRDATLAAALLQFADDGKKCYITEKTEAHDGYRMPEMIDASQIVYAKGEHLPGEKLQLLQRQLSFYFASNSPR